MGRHRGKRRPANGTLRIIGGRWRGRKLPVAAIEGLRPTPDRVRETLFNWLAFDLQDLRCLDLYSGSGALGFEALSRGAASVLMLDSAPAAVRTLQQSRDLLQAAAEVRQAEALSFLRQAPDSGFDLVFVDPPFASELWTQTLALLPPWLRPGHRVYVESDTRWAGPESTVWETLKHKTAGDVAFRLLRYCGSLSAAQRGDET